MLLTLPGVADVAVTGVPDEIAGELPKALIVKESGYNLSADEIKQFVKGDHFSLATSTESHFGMV